MSFGGNTPELLRSYVERVQRIEDEVRGLNDDKSDIYKEAKGNGLDVKVLKRVVAELRKPASERSEFDELFALYWAAVTSGTLDATRARTSVEG